MLPFTSPKEALLACPLSPLWSLLSFTVESNLSSPSSRSDPLSLVKVRLSLTLTLSPLTIWCSGQTALFLFFLAKAFYMYLPTALSVALRPHIPFQQAHYSQVFPLKPVPFFTFFAGLGSVNGSTTSLILLSDSRFVLTTLSSPASFLLPQSLRKIWQELSFFFTCSIRLQWVPGHSFLPENNATKNDELARRGALIVPSAIPCSLSPLISPIHSCLFSDWRRTVPSKFFHIQVSSISTEELVLPRHARCVFSRLHCNGHSLLLSSYLSRIGRMENQLVKF